MVFDVDKQYEEWLAQQGEIEVFDDKETKDIIMEELEFLSKMDVKEYTLFRKFREIGIKYPVKSQSSPFLKKSSVDPRTQYPKIQELKNNIWFPESPEDVEKINPVLLLTDDYPGLIKDWNALRVFTSTMINSSNIGRNMYYVVIDEVTEKFLGLIQITGDYLDLGPRDKHIGWTRDQKNAGMVKHMYVGSTIVPTQPLGFNFLGGKLLALLVTTDKIQNDWYKKYGDIAVGASTTSLYGTQSQYNGLKPFWKTMGHSQGNTSFEPSPEILLVMRNWLKGKFTRQYWEWYHGKREGGAPLKRDYKQRSMQFAFKKLNIPKEMFQTSHQRGIYNSFFYEKSCEFLRQEVPEEKLGKKTKDFSLENLTEFWRKKARKRVASVVKDGRYTTEGLFYDDLIGATWEEIKEKYLPQVGR